jgi:hypothetical protein
LMMILTLLFISQITPLQATPLIRHYWLIAIIFRHITANSHWPILPLAISHYDILMPFHFDISLILILIFSLFHYFRYFDIDISSILLAAAPAEIDTIIDYDITFSSFRW